MRILSSEGTAAIPAGGSFCNLSIALKFQELVFRLLFLLFKVSHQTKTRWCRHSSRKFQSEKNPKEKSMSRDSASFVVTHIKRQISLKPVH